MYAKFWKRVLDFCLSFLAVCLLSPLLLILTAAGAIALGGNPFYIQKRPGRRGRDGKEKIFSLIKFRSMTNEKDASGKLLPDAQRLNRYGRIIRALSLDELPEFFNILIGDMSFVGPRPLAVKYLPYYTREERRRHDVRPGLTGLAQANGRNSLSWDDKFRFDLQYAERITFAGDLKILLLTVKKVLARDGIGQGEEIPRSLHVVRADWTLTDDGALPPAQG